MNRIKTKYEDVISIENLIAADQIIRTRNNYNCRVQAFDNDWYNNIYRLHLDLKHFNYSHSGYDVFYATGADGKKRKISVCSNYRDRIVQKAIIIASKDELEKKLVGNTYASIPRRGAHKAIRKIQKVVAENTLYCFQGDIYHFFEEISQEALSDVLGKMFRDQSIVWLYRQMMAAVEKGIVLGAEESQWNANLALCGFDHMVLEECKPDYYFRYCDDIVLLDKRRENLEAASMKIEQYLSNISLRLKPSKRIFFIAEKRRKKGESGEGCGLDFLGYVFYRHHTDLRTKTKNRWRRRLHILNRMPGNMQATNADMIAHGAIIGLLKHCNSKNLLNKWKNDYPNYFERLRRHKAAKTAAAERRKDELAALLERTKRTGDPGAGSGECSERAVVG